MRRRKTDRMTSGRSVVYYESLKRKLKKKMNVGAMKDYKLELRNLHASHALGEVKFFFFKNDGTATKLYEWNKVICKVGMTQLKHLESRARLQDTRI